LGLDTESYVARTKFCTESELIATIQISDGKKAFVFDAKNISNPIIGEVLSGFFLNPKKILVGHTLQDDLDVTLNALGIKEKAKCQCIDVKFDFKKLHPGKRAGLQSISEVILGKPICKNYTLTDWGRRPLLKNQLHYAALDAVVVIHIWRRI
jgi:ribonuclease D